MNGVLKGMLLMLVILYIVSPVDACPGPIDDIIVMLIWCASQKAATAIETTDTVDEYVE